MKLKDLISALPVGLLGRVVGSTEVEVLALNFDSRVVEHGGVFFAVRGVAQDGHQYIGRAVSAGAAVVVCEELPTDVNLISTSTATSTEREVSYVVVSDSSLALAWMAAEFYGNPSRELKLVGVTGTNGKTTTVTLLHELFARLGYKCGLLSTVVNIVGDQRFDTTHTTPDPLVLNAMLRKMVDAGCQYCFMEVSSHSVVQHRVAALVFAGGVFTNLTHDHLDYHGTFAEYIKAKKGFFDALPRESFALINRDDRNGEVMVQNCNAGRKVGYSLMRMADYQCRMMESTLQGMLLQINGLEVWSRLLGRFNAYNLTAIYGVACELGIEPMVALEHISALGSVAGRMECFVGAGESDGSGGVLGVVDYAHTPDALKNVLQTIADFKGPASKVITVVGCGGDRDAAKRPVMAAIAAQYSDRVILTSDNPRSEDPMLVLEQMRAGVTGDGALGRVLVIESRADAIRTAVALATATDVILVAGKGHETYQEVKGVRHHFDDREVLFGALGAAAKS